MSFRDASSESTGSNARTTPPGDPSRIERIAGLAIVAIGLVVLADVLGRYLESVEPAAAVDDVRKQRGGSTPHGRTRIEIGEADGTDRTEASTGADASEGAEAIDDETNADLTAENRSAEEIDERAASDAQDEPATPGEMTIDEDVADELRDDEDEE